MIDTILPLPPQHQCVDSLLSDTDCMPPSFGEGRMLFHFEPSDNDVIYSQHSQLLRNHAGNVAFQAIIDENVYEYSTARSELAKAAIVSHIVETIQTRSPNGGFVEQIGGQWFEIGAWNARERVLRALQDTVISGHSGREETVPVHDVIAMLDILVAVCRFVSEKKRTSSGTFEKSVSSWSPQPDVRMGHLNWEVLNRSKREVCISHQPTAGVVVECRSPRSF